jgi:hypothetical protein
VTPEDLSGTGTLTTHKVHQPEIDLIETDRARGVWGLEDVVVSTELGVTIRGSAFYTDEYRKLDGSWRISSTGYKRVYERWSHGVPTSSSRRAGGIPAAGARSAHDERSGVDTQPTGCIRLGSLMVA